MESEQFWAALARPFLAFIVLLPVWYLRRWLQRHMRDSWWKEALLKRRGVALERAFQRGDDRIASVVAAGWRKIRGPR